MDFSSTERALKSLERRTPHLSDAVKSLAKTLLHTDICDSSYLKCTKDVLQIGTDGEDGEHASPRWEPLAVGFHLTASYLHHITAVYYNDASKTSDVYMDGPRVPSMDVDKQSTVDEKLAVKFDEAKIVPFCEFIMSLCQAHLEHKEPRVRSLVAKVVGQHAKLGNVLKSQDEIGAALNSQSVKLYKSILSSLYEHLASGRDTENKSKSSEGALDDTTGWRALETNLYGIGSFVQASGEKYFEIDGEAFSVDSELLKSLEYCCVTHVNRHVRAAGINVLEQMVHACAASYDNADDNGYDKDNRGPMDMLLLPDSQLRRCIVQVLKTALSDNWSQVRMAGSVLCRVFFVTMLEYAKKFPKNMDEKEVWLTSTYPILLPRMCLNRFYLAQGVKLYSHETWKILFDQSKDLAGSGLESVAMNAAPVCRYYVKMCDADNHVVREAACQAVAELATKIGRSAEYSEYLAPFVMTLLQVSFLKKNTTKEL